MHDPVLLNNWVDNKRCEQNSIR